MREKSLFTLTALRFYWHLFAVKSINSVKILSCNEQLLLLVRVF